MDMEPHQRFRVPFLQKPHITSARNRIVHSIRSRTTIYLSLSVRSLFSSRRDTYIFFSRLAYHLHSPILTTTTMCQTRLIYFLQCEHKGSVFKACENLQGDCPCVNSLTARYRLEDFVGGRCATCLEEACLQALSILEGRAGKFRRGEEAVKVGAEGWGWR